MGFAFWATEVRVSDDDALLFVWFWFATLCTAVGFVLPIRQYLGSIGWPRESHNARPSVASLLGIIAYFGLVPLPLAVSIPGGRFGAAVFAVALCATAVSAGPPIILMCARTWARILAATGCILTYIVWGLASSEDQSFAETAPAVFSPLVASIVTCWAGLRIRR